MLLALPAIAAAEVTRTTYRVPVDSPDELGRAVALDVDVHLPDGPAPASGFPLVLMFHGGGGHKDNEVDLAHARRFAAHGYAAILYSARGHGGSDGQLTVAGPKEIRDLFDVLRWAFDEQRLALDRGAIALWGYSQGGLHTNLAQVWADDRDINPGGLEFRAMLPGNTPDRVFEALVDREVVKLSFGVGLIGTYAGGTGARMAPVVDKWVATAAADRPELYGGDVCDAAGHDTAVSTMKADLAWRSVGCRAERMTLPTYWMQAFDDGLFPAEMAVNMLGRMPHPANRLHLSMGGHGAPGAPGPVEAEKIGLQIAFLDHVLRGAPFGEPGVVYWTRDLGVPVAAGTTQWPEGAWYRQTAGSFPPAGVGEVVLRLSADGRAVAGGPAAAGDVRLTAPELDAGNDPVTSSVLGTTPPPANEGAEFAGDPVAEDTEISGAPVARLPFTPSAPDAQVVLKLFAEAPGGTRTLLTRGVAGIRGALPGEPQEVAVSAQMLSARLPRGHRLIARIAAGDATFYKPYPGSAGGVMTAGDAATLTLPLRTSGVITEDPPAPGCSDRRAPVTRVRSARVRGRRLRIDGRSRDRTCPEEAALAARRIARVFVAVRRRAGGRCRFASERGRLTTPRPCRRARWLEPDGAARWRLSLPAGRLAAGRYAVVVQSVDVRGNVERPRVARRLWIR